MDLLSTTPSQPQPQSQPLPKGQLLTLDQTEERILHLLTLASNVASSLSEVHPDSVIECQTASRDFYSSLRLIHASLLAQIRTHAADLQHLTAAAAPPPLAPAPGQPPQPTSGVSAHEYRRNVYLDAQSMQVAMENLELTKARMNEIMQEQQQQDSQSTSIKQER